ncbi:hypothetical protein GCM10017674_53250 [Streptomyces gardneri]|uniref:Uncharacterized protein n=1 Tax=Streptomyces gardneri TaxID=66892 RepID=A0A4Y3RCB1_9ACTN|nr:hypothetical protein SGA01_09270 [Streptomyces gardneri]GHH09650.1 hypothetical protein GCM10017674_53250 [Streptomyces gardneri]
MLPLPGGSQNLSARSGVESETGAVGLKMLQVPDPMNWSPLVQLSLTATAQRVDFQLLLLLNSSMSLRQTASSTVPARPGW